MSAFVLPYLHSSYPLPTFLSFACFDAPHAVSPKYESVLHNTLKNQSHTSPFVSFVFEDVDANVTAPTKIPLSYPASPSINPSPYTTAPYHRHNEYNTERLTDALHTNPTRANKYSQKTDSSNYQAATQLPSDYESTTYV